MTRFWWWLNPVNMYDWPAWWCPVNGVLFGAMLGALAVWMFT